MGDITWLHLSDFHFRTKKSPNTSTVEPYNQKLVLDSLLADLEEYPTKNGLKIDFAIITGDIAYSGLKHEYDEAAKFFDKLLDKLNLKKDRLFVVPGNHDIDRGKVSKSQPLTLNNLDDINEFLMNDVDKAFQFRKFDGYRNFIKRYFDGHLIFGYKSKYFWTKEFLIRDEKIGLMGLNSAWCSCGDNEERKLLIGERQLSDALERTKKANLTIAVFHHPLDWLRRDGTYNDERSVRRDLGKRCQFILHGHLHQQDYDIRRNPDSEIHIIPAGACYDKRPYRNACNYVKFNPATKRGELHLRAYSDNLRKWIEDVETFANTRNGICDINLNPPASESSLKPNIVLEIPETYRNWVDTRCYRMDIDRLVDSQDKALISLTLPEIFIPLYGNPPGDEKTIRRQKRGMEEEKQRSEDIEQLAAKNDYLLMKGQAGSGKTTLMKHLAYTIIHGKNDNGLNGYLPVLMFLKELPQLNIGIEKEIPGTPTAEKMLAAYFKATGSGLSIELLKAFCTAGKALFLIDGLDEIDSKIRNVVVNSLASFRTDNNCAKMVLAGRPHGIDVHVNDHFGDKRVDINPLHMGQVRLFIDKWHKFDKELDGKGITPSKMFEDIRKHPNIEELIATPLMLTAACILYHYDKKLPEQRAELYEKFINNLICKRFVPPEPVQDYLMKLASMVHGKRKRDFSKSFAIDLLAPENPQKNDENARQYRLRLEAEFDRIDENCGLLKLENGQYSFWHLTFQEFLAARDIAVHQTKHAEAIKAYWDDEWYEEVVQLLVGHLSSTSGCRAIALEIVENELRKDESSPFRHWRLASKSLASIQLYSVKDKQVIEKAQKRLLSIFEGESDPKMLADAGETLGWLGDPREDLKDFISIEGGEYDLEELGACSIKPFQIGKYPLTNRWYDEFIKAGGYENEDFWTPEGKKWLRKAKEKPEQLHERIWKCPNLPVTEVCWYEADAFCRWLTVAKNDGYLYRLPTEQEWQAAAAGKDKRKYPWGDAWQENTCNTRETGIEKTTAVGIFLKGTTPQGVADLAGNVWEWTDNWYDSGRDSKALRGGSWYFDSGFARCASRFRLYPDFRDSYIGFRCARIKK